MKISGRLEVNEDCEETYQLYEEGIYINPSNFRKWAVENTTALLK